MRDRIRKAIAFDPLDEAEKQTGKSYKTDNDTAMLGFKLMQSNTQEINSLLKRSDDSCYSHSVGDYLRIVRDIGFEKLYHDYFVNKYGKTNQYFLLFHRELAILMVIDTFSSGFDPSDSINRSDMYFNWEPNSEANRRKGTSSGHFHKDSNRYIWIGNNDSRLAIRNQIEELKEYGTFVNPWIERPHLYLYHHGDKKDSSHSTLEESKNMTKTRLEYLPEDVIAIISPN